MPTLLITGGSGYLGSELVRQAKNLSGYDVVATYSSHPITVEGIRSVQLDLRAEHAIHVLDDIRPHAIIHTAYVQRGPDLWQVSAEGARKVAEYAQQNGAKLIHLSSDAIFDGEKNDAYSEADVPNPMTPYGEAKAAAEQFVAMACPTALIVRTSLIYGGVTPSPHEQAVFDALDGKSDLVFFTDEKRNPIHVADLANTLLELLQTDCEGILHVAGSAVVSRYDFARLIAKAAGRSPDALRSGLSAASGMRRPRNVSLDSSRAESLLNMPLRSVYELLGLE